MKTAILGLLLSLSVGCATFSPPKCHLKTVVPPEVCCEMGMLVTVSDNYPSVLMTLEGCACLVPPAIKAEPAPAAEAEEKDAEPSE